ncbi:hypothetical protein BUALT_Bualt07G0090800 [Buddleja alternifolia]|uniref:GRF-type domain-containing protein n=1 Tax=Buddleja alternifolia TaxID=168488 RepID=A0AAV6XDS5_9LAMI|nr:hypothetical protein BUALT_Bualt07G0090800 [Buddleja alternifolia]
MSQSSSTFRPQTSTLHKCDCRHPKTARVRTSWTNDNPGRRFKCCADGKCDFFTWFDPPMCARSKLIIPGLLRRLNRQEEEIRKLQQSCKTVEEVRVQQGQKSHKGCIVLVAIVLMVLVWIFFFEG